MNLEKQVDLEWRLEEISNDIDKRLKEHNQLLHRGNLVNAKPDLQKIITKIESEGLGIKPTINTRNKWQSEIYELTAIKSELFRKQNSATHQLEKKCTELESINGQLDLKKIISNRKNMTSHIQNNKKFDIDKIQSDQLDELKKFYSIANPFLK